MRKVDLYSKSKIEKESEEKKTYTIKLDGSDSEYFFEEYASKVYQNVRRIYDVDDGKIAEMFGPGAKEHLDVKISTGKGGAFFVKNKKDPSILIKSVTPGEYEVLKNFTASFYTHLLLHPDSLVAPFLGVYTLALRGDDSIEPISFLLMKSVFDTKVILPH